MSMRELAHFSRASHATIQRIENGAATDVAPATLARLARALRVPVAELWPLDPVNESDDAEGTAPSLETSPAPGVSQHGRVY